MWDEFHTDWERLAVECQLFRQQLDAPSLDEPALENETRIHDDFTGETRQVLTTQRTKPQFFRRAVLSSYRRWFYMSGLSDARLLIASHTVPWGSDKAKQLNPRSDSRHRQNALCGIDIRF